MSQIYGRRSSRFSLLLLACLLLILACGRGGGEPAVVELDEPATGVPADAEPAESGGAFQDQSFPIDKQFWHSGFRVQLGDGRLFAEENEFTDEVRYFLALEAMFENLGNDQTFFDGATALTWEGDSAPLLLSSDRPSVPAGLSSAGEFIFEVSEDFDLASAQLIVGSADENQAQIPLAEAGGEIVTLEPSQPEVTGSISMELVDLSFTSGELRADRPESYREVEAGKLALTLNFDATSRKSGNWNILPQDFALLLPNGGAVAPDRTDLGSLPGSEAGIVTSDLSVRFLVDDPPGGDYTLRFTPGSWFIGNDGATEATMEFTLP